MGAYAFNSNNHFLRYSSKLHNIQVYELQNPDSLPLSFHDWKLVVSIGPAEEYDSLKVFDTVIDGIRLKNLEEDLCNSHLMINPEGFCYLDTTEIVGPTFNVQYYKLNDLFCWSEYVDVPSNVMFKTSWMRCGIQTGDAILDYDQSSKDMKHIEDELESTRKQFAMVKIVEQELKNKKDELNDARNKISEYERRLEDNNMLLRRLRDRLEERDRDRETRREELRAATNELKHAEQELKQKHDELLEANNEISQYETRLEEKDRKIGRLRDKLFSSETKLEELVSHNNIKKQNEVKRVIRNEAQPSSSMSNNDGSTNIQKRMSIEWQNLTEVWNRNKEKVSGSIFINELRFTTLRILSAPRLDGQLQEFKELEPFNNFRYSNKGFIYSVKGRFDWDNWWCIGSYEHGKKIDLFVYEGRRYDIEAHNTKVYVPYPEKFFISSVQCFVGLLHGVGFRFMYVAARH